MNPHSDARMRGEQVFPGEWPHASAALAAAAILAAWSSSHLILSSRALCRWAAILSSTSPFCIAACTSACHFIAAYVCTVSSTRQQGSLGAGRIPLPSARSMPSELFGSMYDHRHLEP